MNSTVLTPIAQTGFTIAFLLAAILSVGTVLGGLFCALDRLVILFEK